MAEMAVLAALGWVASPLVKMLIDKGIELLGTSMDEKRKTLAATALPRLYLAIEKAEKSPEDKKYMLEDLLKRLKHAYYQAEDAVDLLEYQQLHLKGHIDKIIEIASEAEKFSDLLKDLENNSTSNPDRVSTSQPLGEVFGLEEDTKIVVGHLTSDIIKNSDQALDVGPSTRSAIPMKIIAITGRSGIGKTTLAQHVYQQRNIQKCFNLVLWVHTPRKFEAIDVVKNIVQTAQKKYDDMDKGNYDSSAPLEALRAQMQGMLGSKKVLLVLDDFWCDDENFIEQWEKFISCLRGWSLGSKILLTTQYERAKEKARLAGETEVTTHTIGELTPEQLLELFMHHAWPSNNTIPREEFEIIGRKIVSKLKGDLGATKMVGRRLSNKLDLMHWNDIAERDWLGDKMKARIWSYQQLPLHLQRCFAFCSLFPKNFGFLELNLIQLWMAEGFINPIDEDTGENYLNELVSLFFLEKYVDDGYTYYQLHDLLHDLAERVKGDDFVRIDYTNSTNVPEDINQKLSHGHENIRHISLPGRMFIKLKDKICLMKNLCTLICLENVPSINEANKAKLKSKGRLEKVEFHWSSDERVPNDDFQLLDALQPHSNIMGLKIKWFKGNKFPSWLLCQNSTLEHLVDLQLENCSNVEEISSIDKSLPNCKVLGLFDFNNLKELPLLPPNLTSLTINSCSITNDALSNCIECLHSLSELWLVEIHTITSLPSEGALSALKKLSSLHIEACFLLSSLGGISALSSLTKLAMLGCLNLNSSNKLPSSLKTKFNKCDDSYEVELNGGWFVVKFRKDQSMPGPSQLTQEASTSQPTQQLPPNPQEVPQILADQLQISTTTGQPETAQHGPSNLAEQPLPNPPTGLRQCIPRLFCCGTDR
ncbi:hypothetical protein LUZ63_018933 [Rhynchospora breviuscula]|uniref:NB-ARC domain-containing protein n=1 Tax=Rhynchospora breviuscula TaxID=2022672 RepID=A0A9Q0C5A4_9POAL|nr:hypothetical protein LUZ63_018933 [Rhynchospora breviuscula]